jgi:hypothetical protein
MPVNADLDPITPTPVIVGKPGVTTSEFLNHILAIIASVALAVFHKHVDLTGATTAYLALALNGAASLYSLARSYLKGRTHAAIADYAANRYVHLYDDVTGEVTKVLDVVDGVVTYLDTPQSFKVAPQTVSEDVETVPVPEAEDNTHRAADVPA